MDKGNFVGQTVSVRVKILLPILRGGSIEGLRPGNLTGRGTLALGVGYRQSVSEFPESHNLKHVRPSMGLLENFFPTLESLSVYSRPKFLPTELKRSLNGIRRIRLANWA